MGFRECMSCSWMGDKIAGQDVDSLFAYQTVRVAKIKDRTLGLMRIFLMISIFIYIFIFNIWYKGAHFSFTPVQGVARLQWQEPTVDHCNPAHADCMSDFHDQEDLPYCNDYKGSTPDKVVRDCDYSDSRELPKYIMDGVLMPTYIEKYRQRRSCPPGADMCDRKWKYTDSDGSLQTAEGEAKPVSSGFIADVGRYTLLIDHNFKTDKSWLAFDDYKMQGYFVDCPKGKTSSSSQCATHEIKCVHSGCKDLKLTKRPSFLDIARSNYKSWMYPDIGIRPQYHRKGFAHGKFSSQLWYDEDSVMGGSQAISLAAKQSHVDDGRGVALDTADSNPPDDDLKVISISNGDVLSLETMLRMAGRTLDEIWVDKKEGPQSIRLRGVALVISIEYYNLKRWTLYQPENPPWYTISIDAMESHKYKDFSVTSEDANSRDLSMSYGVYMVVKQSGHLAYFDPIYGLVAMTSAMALMAVSNTLTDFLMVSVLPRKDEYYAEKYKESDDFSDTRKPSFKEGTM